MVETQLVLPTVGDLKPESGMYCLASDALESFVFNLDWGQFKEECNLGKALDHLHGAKLRELDFMQVRNSAWDIYKIDTYEVKVEANFRHLRILRELLELTCKGVKPLDATWFYYDSDGQNRLFFVVYSGIIVEDWYKFLNDHPLILTEGMGWAESDFGWYGHPGFAEAFERYW